MALSPPETAADLRQGYRKAFYLGFVGGWLGLHDLYLGNRRRFLIRLFLTLLFALAYPPLLLFSLLWWWVDLLRMKTLVDHGVKVSPQLQAPALGKGDGLSQKPLSSGRRGPKTAFEELSFPVLCDEHLSPFLQRRLEVPLALLFPRGAIEDEDFAFLWSSASPHRWIHPSRPRFLFVDVETTGLSPHRDTILEMALSLFALEGDRLYLVASYVGWEDPKGPVPREAYRINRLHHRHLRGRHIDWEVVKRFFELADVAVGHNVRRFDARFLSPVIPSASWLDTLSFPWRNHLAVPDRRLETLLRHLGLPTEGAHAALYDTLALAAALQMVEGGIGWLKGSFEKKREEIRQALKVFRQDLLQRYPTEGPLELEVVAGDLELKVRLTRGKQVRWYGEDGRPLTREMLEDRLWEVYLARRHRMDRPLLEVSWRE